MVHASIESWIALTYSSISLVYLLCLCFDTPIYHAEGAMYYCAIFPTRAYGRSKGCMRVTRHRISPALSASPIWITDGLHDLHIYITTRRRAKLRKKHQHSTFPAPNNQASDSCVVRNLATRHALATVAITGDHS